MTHHHPLTRRDFVAAATLGTVGLLRGTVALAERAAPMGADLLLYVGTYTDAGRTDGLHVLRMDTGTGALRLVEALDVGPNPSYLTIHPNGRTLYSVNEVTETEGRPTGAVRAFAIDAESGALTWLDEQPSEGGAPCYVSTDRKGRFALVANYVAGSVAVLPVDETGALSHAVHLVQQMGSGPVKARQEHAHAHCVVAHPSNRFVLVADLGVDRVVCYRLDEERGTLRHVEENDAVMPPGTGPRHLAFHPTLPLVFVSGELNSTVTALHCDPASGALRVVQSLSTLPRGWTGENFPADIHVAPSGRTLYVSNRGHDSVATFSIGARGTLALEQATATGGLWPRNFTIDPTGRWLLVANQKSASVVVFARDPDSGRLTPTSQRIEIPAPACVRFQGHAGV